MTTTQRDIVSAYRLIRAAANLIIEAEYALKDIDQDNLVGEWCEIFDETSKGYCTTPGYLLLRAAESVIEANQEPS